MWRVQCILIYKPDDAKVASSLPLVVDVSVASSASMSKSAC